MTEYKAFFLKYQREHPDVPLDGLDYFIGWVVFKIGKLMGRLIR